MHPASESLSNVWAFCKYSWTYFQDVSHSDFLSRTDLLTRKWLNIYLASEFIFSVCADLSQDHCHWQWEDQQTLFYFVSLIPSLCILLTKFTSGPFHGKIYKSLLFWIQWFWPILNYKFNKILFWKAEIFYYIFYWSAEFLLKFILSYHDTNSTTHLHGEHLLDWQRWQLCGIV